MIDDPASGSAGPSSDLGQIGERRVVKIGGVRFAGRRRRPSGEKEPLPREFRGTGTFWAVVALSRPCHLDLALRPRRVARLVDATGFETVAAACRTCAQTPLRRCSRGSTSSRPNLSFAWCRWGTILALVFYKRWRHLVAGMAVFLIVDLVSTGMAAAVARPRPLVEILVSWEGYSHPSAPLASLAATLGVIGYSLIPTGQVAQLVVLRERSAAPDRSLRSDLSRC